MKVERSLALELERREVAVGAPLTVRVRASDAGNRPIEGAVVDAGSGAKRNRTDARGLCEFTFRAPGFWKLVARKADSERVSYEPATAVVRAVPEASAKRGARSRVASR